MARPEYRLDAERDGKWWVAIGVGATGDLPFQGPLTQGRTLEELRRMIRDAIALMREVPEDSFDIDLRVKLPGQLRDIEDQAREKRAAAEQAQRIANETTTRAVQLLRAAGLGLRDVGELVGISYQRAAQIEHDPQLKA